MFIRIPDHINKHDLLKYICEEYQFLRYYEGVMILSLECAKAADTSGTFSFHQSVFALFEFDKQSESKKRQSHNCILVKDLPFNGSRME
jgi:hypothetical protein